MSAMHRMAAIGVNLLDIGHDIVMVGALYQGKGHCFVVMYPDEVAVSTSPTLVEMTSDEWEGFLSQADRLECEVEVNEADGTVRKAILRKSQRQIDTHIQWFCFRRDQFTCCYCGRDDVPLTVDHLVLWEERGPSTADNLLSACRKCNKERGRMQYGAWLMSPYYAKVSANLTPERRDANLFMLGKLDAIQRVHRQRSR